MGRLELTLEASRLVERVELATMPFDEWQAEWGCYSDIPRVRRQCWLDAQDRAETEAVAQARRLARLLLHRLERIG